MSTPTGVQIHLEAGGVRAQISQVGASLRHLVVGGTTVVPPYPEDQPAPACAGVVLVPWPNRIRDGIWIDGDETRALAITEPKLNNAIHGLLRYSAYEIAERSEGSVLLRADVVPQLGYPYLLETSVRYTLDADGITAEHTIVNRSATPAPVALGTHPYVTIGDTDPRELRLRIPAETFFETDDRLLPVGESPVSGGTDLRTPRRLADLQLDTGFATLRRDADGLVRSTLTAEDGRVATLWQGEGLDYLQAYTNTSYPGQELVVALEPMSAPAEGFNSGRGLRRLAPGDTWTAQWGVSLTV
ncbi:aldose 1-epimerase family protein [Microbacterium panaciterrae]|uniref:Aldose 1-epimerase family protein n=1 Tax=Microbacterium panaciterrae TaxID=985759 RepID=A0ABP8P5B8_9MICO